MTERPTVEPGRTSHGCAKTVYSGAWGGSPCARKGVNLENSEWWCKQHTPSLITAKRAADRAKWDAEWKRKNQVARERKQAESERDRRAACFPDLLAALKALLPILRQAHDRGFAIKEVEPVYNQAEAAIKQAEAK